jgi:hypothetical protein
MPRLSNNDRNQAMGMLRVAHAKRCWRCRGVSSGPLNDRLARRPFSCSLRCTVAELIRGLCLPGVSLAVDAAVLKRLRKCYSRI